MGLFSSSWKYYAFAATTPLLESEADYPHTFEKVMLEGLSADDSFGNIIRYSLATDMYARAKAMVRYATREVDPYIRGLPESNLLTSGVQKTWVEQAILREIKMPLEEFFWFRHGIFDAHYVGCKFIHDHYMDIEYFPWPEGCLPDIKNPNFDDGTDFWIWNNFQVNTTERVAEMTASNGTLFSEMVGEINPGDIISLRATCSRGSDDPAQTGQINITFYDSQGSEISTESAANTETPGNEWELLTVIATAPAGTATCKAWAGGTMRSCAILTGLAHWWTMDEASGANRVDSVGDATLIDGSTVNQSSAAKWNKSALFSSDFFTASLAGSLIDNQGTFSGAFWVRFTTTATSQGRDLVLLKKGSHDASDGTGEAWSIGMSQAGLNRLYFRVSGPDLYKTVYFSTSCTTNTWYHVYFYYDAVTGEIGIRRNNASTSKNTFGGTDLMYDLNELDVGRWSSVSTRYHAGYLDEIGLWNKLLEQEEIDFLYGASGSAVGYDSLSIFCDDACEPILWAGDELVSSNDGYVNFYFYEGNNGIPAYLDPPYDSTCGYYSGGNIAFARTISDKYDPDQCGMGNNSPFSTGDFLIKFEVVEVLSGTPAVKLGYGSNYAYGREGQWWDLFRTDLALVYVDVGIGSIRINVTIAVDSGSGDGTSGNGIPVSGTEVTRSCVLVLTGP